MRDFENYLTDGAGIGADGHPPELRPGANDTNELPHVVLPSGTVTITECATQLFKLIAPTQKLFMRGGAVVGLVKRDDGLLALDVLRPASARSLFEKFGRLFAWRVGGETGPVLKPTTCPHEMADALLQSEEAGGFLPRVNGLINCPFMREVEGQLVVAGPGYDPGSLMLVTGGKTPPIVPLDEAVKALLDLLTEFDFQTEGDKARAVASIIGPALKVGGFIKGRVPADVAEADHSQSGKTYRQKVLAALYNERLSLVTNREGGVGSVDESLNQQLVAGRPFIQFDNFRGRFASAHLEAFMTAEGSFPCRVPYRPDVTVSPENYFICLSSNGVDTTRDFANRSNIIRNLKQPPGYKFRKFTAGDLLAHVRHSQTYYLGCLFAVIWEWHRRGKLQTEETRHDFREWVQVVDWIAQNTFKTVPVMDGHQQAQERVSNPSLVWVRHLVLAVANAGEMTRGLTATDIYGLCEGADIQIPGLRAGADEEKGRKIIGSIMGKLFRDQDTLEVDGYIVTREERYISRDKVSEGGNFKSKIYTITIKQ
jgi:hypothetical protein